MGNLASTKILLAKGDRPAVQHEVLKKPHKVWKADDVVFTITGDSLIIFRKKFHFPNDLVMKVPTKSDRACAPPEFLTVYEFNLRAGLQFPPASELIDILRICGNNDYVNVKYLHGEYKKKYDAKIKKMKVVDEQIAECRAELATMLTSVSLQNQQIDRLHIDLVDAQAMINQYAKDQKTFEEKIAAAEDENKKLQSLLSEKEIRS
ncbi:hypothetical protein M5K25_023797 [Dendrobium thyrsiflorum]|uniref:Uncharacterized protein n=1 Tax=Dendrobium thyrsiflorum TaxID=117978 RepID=A0ABD0U0M0_DENTH